MNRKFDITEFIIKAVFAVLVAAVIYVTVQVIINVVKEEVQTDKKVSENTVEDEIFVAKGKNNNNIFVWTDKETGVQYIAYKDRNGCAITPRLDSDGSLYCVETKTAEQDEKDSESKEEKYK